MSSLFIDDTISLLLCGFKIFFQEFSGIFQKEFFMDGSRKCIAEMVILDENVVFMTEIIIFKTNLSILVTEMVTLIFSFEDLPTSLYEKTD